MVDPRPKRRLDRGMKAYLVNWSDDGISRAETFVSTNAREAYLMFVKGRKHLASYKTRSIGVWMKDGSPGYDEFDDHLITMNLKYLAKAVVSTNEKFDKLYNVMNHIRWMMVGFIFVTIIVPTIIYWLLK
jgi:hypothetical protein